MTRRTAGRAARSIPDSKPTKRRFWVRLDALVEIDDRLLASVLTDEWRQDYYRLLTAGDVATHLAYNLIQGSSLASLDGFADQPEDRATLLEIDVDDVADEVPDDYASGPGRIRDEATQPQPEATKKPAQAEQRTARQAPKTRAKTRAKSRKRRP